MKLDQPRCADRVLATTLGIDIIRKPACWPAIPLPVLLRAAVQCHRLREGKHV